MPVNKHIHSEDNSATAALHVAPPPSASPQRQTSTASSPILKRHLLRLPAELRNQIYIHLLGNGMFSIDQSNSARTRWLRFYFKKGDTFGSYSTRDSRLQRITALSRVCRQLHAETALLLFSLNPVRSIVLPSLRAFRDTLTGDQRDTIKELHLIIGPRDLGCLAHWPNGSPSSDSGAAPLENDFLWLLQDFGGLEVMRIRDRLYRNCLWGLFKSGTFELGERVVEVVMDQTIGT
jgi:hypothetical protein